jgi:hypothetical protein
MALPAYKRKGAIRRALLDATAFFLNGLSATVTLTKAGAPTNGTNGTGAGTALPGQLLQDTTGGVVYQNTGTQASPAWTPRFSPVGDAQSVTTGITASTTQTLAGATALTTKLNFVATAANSGDAVSLPALVPGQSVTVFNDGANPIKVFPAAANVAIDGGSAGAAVTLTNAKRATFFCKSATAITSAQLGVVSA